MKFAFAAVLCFMFCGCGDEECVMPVGQYNYTLRSMGRECIDAGIPPYKESGIWPIAADSRFAQCGEQESFEFFFDNLLGCDVIKITKVNAAGGEMRGTFTLKLMCAEGELGFWFLNAYGCEDRYELHAVYGG